MKRKVTLGIVSTMTDSGHYLLWNQECRTGRKKRKAAANIRSSSRRKWLRNAMRLVIPCRLSRAGTTLTRTYCFAAGGLCSRRQGPQSPVPLSLFSCDAHRFAQNIRCRNHTAPFLLAALKRLDKIFVLRDRANSRPAPGGVPCLTDFSPSLLWFFSSMICLFLLH
jgi:hypothetical protein